MVRIGAAQLDGPRAPRASQQPERDQAAMTSGTDGVLGHALQILIVQRALLLATSWARKPFAARLHYVSQVNSPSSSEITPIQNASSSFSCSRCVMASLSSVKWARRAAFANHSTVARPA